MNQLAPSPSTAFHQSGGNPFAYSQPPPPPHQTSPQQQQGNFGLGPFAGQSLGYASSHGASGGRSLAMPPPPVGTPQGQHSYTSAPSQPIPAQLPPQQPTRPIRPSASPPLHQHPQQQQQQRASPPNAAPQHPTPPQATTKYPMAAPPLPNTPSSTTGAPTTSASPPRTPLSPNSENREAQRIAHLLHLNSALLSEISALQASGQGGVLNPAQAEQARQKGLPDKMASEDYIHTMRRVQANLQYLMSKNQPAGADGGKKIEGPAIMTAPPHLGERLKGEYERLRELFPEWNGIEGKSGGGTPGRQGSGFQQQGQQGQMPQQPQPQ